MIDLKKLFFEGVRAEEAKHKEQDEKKLGVLRGGSVGCVLTSDGDMSTGFDVIGTCPREATARFVGIQAPIAKETHIMFQLGLTNEDVWSRFLDASSYDGVIKREEELGLEWDIDGVQGTGRPDIVMCDKEGKPKLGIELKMTASVWTARNVLLEHKPNMKHLIQAANYSYRMDTPFELWYTSYVNLAGPDFVTRIVPKRGEKGSEWIEYSLGEIKPSTRSKSGKTFKKIFVYNKDWGKSNEFLKSEYGVNASQFKHIKPFITGYLLKWEGDRLYWTPESDRKNWVETPVTKTGIDQYYQLIVDSVRNKTLPPEPASINCFGELEKYDVTDYSFFKSITNQTDDYEEWMELSKQLVIDETGD